MNKSAKALKVAGSHEYLNTYIIFVSHSLHLVVSLDILIVLETGTYYF